MSSRILVTDTDRSVADEIVSGLDPSLCTATVALDNIDTLDALADEGYDLAVIDIDLPEGWRAGTVFELFSPGRFVPLLPCPGWFFPGRR